MSNREKHMRLKIAHDRLCAAYNYNVSPSSRWLIGKTIYKVHDMLLRLKGEGLA